VAAAPVRPASPPRVDPTAALAAAAAARAAVPQPARRPAQDTVQTTEILQNLAARLKEPAATGIWDIEDEAPAARPASAPAPDRAARRNKTRLIGFDTAEGSVVDLFDDQEEAAPAMEGLEAAPAAAAQSFPVGWAVVIHGPGRGNAFPLSAGMSSVGRGEGQTVRLDFGDAAISREGHAHIAYDPEVRTFLLGQGGKSNIVRLNGRAVVSTEPMEDGAQIKIGETILMLKTLCGPDFDWADTDDGEEDDDVAIA
jgi:hypothetical protein